MAGLKNIGRRTKIYLVIFFAAAVVFTLLAVFVLSKDAVSVAAGLEAFVLFIAFLYFSDRHLKLSFTVRVVVALFIGVIFGVVLQIFFGETDANNKVVLQGAGSVIYDWVNVVGAGFVKLLQFVIVPLVAVSIVGAISKSGNSKESAKKSGKIIGFLLLTTAISAVVSIAVTKIFNLSASHLIDAEAVNKEPTDIPSTILSLVPSNLFEAFSSNSVLPVALISASLGFIYLVVSKTNPAVGSRFKAFVDTAHEFVTKAIEFIIGLTPFGILAIVATRAATGSAAAISQLGLIIAASFTAMAIVFVLHLVLLYFLGAKPINYLKKAGPALLFAFSSRSSAATLPLTVTAQRKLGVGRANATLAATFGTCIGQNGCAGVYPTMLAILVGSAQGWNVWSVYFIVPLVLYVVIASIGTAGVGGGATQVSLVVLSFLGLPVSLVAILISVDFIIDMGRTLLNVNDSILAGYVVGKWEKDINYDLLNDKVNAEEAFRKEDLEQEQGGNI
jgi:L-cystine uptake protein TcyP (sodium:dicarboxylate symporter family)